MSSLTPQFSFGISRRMYPHSLPYNLLRYALPKVVKTRIEIAENYLKSLLKQHLLSFTEDDKGKISPMKFFSAAKDSQPSRPSPSLGDVDMDI